MIVSTGPDRRKLLFRTVWKPVLHINKNKLVLNSRSHFLLFMWILLLFILSNRKTSRRGLSVPDSHDLYRACRREPIEKFYVFDPYAHTKKSRFMTTGPQETPGQEVIWTSVLNNRVYPPWFHAMLKYETFGNLLEQDVSSIEKLASELDGENGKMPKTFTHGQGRKIYLEHMYRRIDRFRGLQYAVQFKKESINHKANMSFSMLVHQQIGANPCRVYAKREAPKDVPMYIIVPYSAREERLRLMLQRFMYLRRQKDLNVVLIIGVVRHSADAKFFRKIVNEMFPSATSDLSRYIWLSENDGDDHGSFSRSVALREAAKLVKENDSVLFFCDVDIHIMYDFVQRCRENSILNSQVFFPVFYNLYSHSRETPVVRIKHGFWSVHSYGMACVRQGDFIRLNPFRDAESMFHGWGPEDIYLYEYIRNKSSLVTFRSIEPGLIHRWHNKHCENDSESYSSCLSSNAASIGHPIRLAEAFRKLLPGVEMEILAKYIRQF